MEHIRQFDWCSSEADVYFLNESELDNCVTERILRNKFYDPLISSDDEQDKKNEINWDEVFHKNNKSEKHKRIYVPGLRSWPPYPKLSALTAQQHYQCLKVLCHQNPTVLPAEFVPRPTKTDHKLFEELKSIYEKEQREYIEWAKTLWMTDQCVRALRPKPAIEMVYEAEFKMRAAELQHFPKDYEMAAQISLDDNKNKFDWVHRKDLININLTELPRIELPKLDRRFTILRPASVPEPCTMHPCKFVLPNESTMSVLPLPEVHRELAQFAAERGAQCVAGERALRCLLELGRGWTLPVSVCSVIGDDGDRTNVLVLGSEFWIQRESAPTRCYRAFKHLLEDALLLPSEKLKKMGDPIPECADDVPMLDRSGSPDLSSDGEDHLIIDAGDAMETEAEEIQNKEPELNESREKELDMSTSNENEEEFSKKDTYYNCTCKDSMFEKPPQRSYRKWQLKNSETSEKFDIIVHCSHKVRNKTGEVILEPVAEYQMDLGGKKVSSDKIKSLALSLFLRRNATLINIRVDSPSGEVVTIDTMQYEEYCKKNDIVLSEVTTAISNALAQLSGLMPGHYILQHEPSHGANALLYAPKLTGSVNKLTLKFDYYQLAEADEAKMLKIPPVLSPVLLPWHKHRKILPCAFTPFENQLAKETKKRVTRQRTPPQAIKWPKRRLRKKKPIMNP